MTVVRSIHSAAAIGCIAITLAACSSSKKTTSTPTLPASGNASSTASTLPGSDEGSGGNADRLFADGADLCKLIDVGELNMASGFIFAPGTSQGHACVYATSDGKTGLIVTAEKDMPDLVLDSKLKLNGVGNVTVKEVTVKGAKRAVLETQPLPSQVNQTLIARYGSGGIQLLLNSATLTDDQAIKSAEAIAG